MDGCALALARLFRRRTRQLRRFASLPLPFPQSLSITPALSTPALLAPLTGSPTLARPPTPPTLPFLPTRVAAITLLRPLRLKPAFAPLQNALPTPRPAPPDLIARIPDVILVMGHGSLLLPLGQVSEQSCQLLSETLLLMARRWLNRRQNPPSVYRPSFTSKTAPRSSQCAWRAPGASSPPCATSPRRAPGAFSPPSAPPRHQTPAA